MSFLHPTLTQRLAVVFIVVAGLPGCSIFHHSSDTERLDPPREIAHRPTDKRPKTMLVGVTTDASGAVTTVEFKRSSGSAAIDNYVAEDIRHNWPGGPSTRSLIELVYTDEKKFSQPKLISSSPVPPG